MADSTTTAATETKTVADDMASRRIFATVTEAAAYLNMCTETYTDFASTPLASQGLDDEGDFDPAIYVPGMAVLVAKLTKTKPKSGIKAIVIAPVPTLEFLLSDAAGTDWVSRIIQKELNHVAVRPLREADDVSTVADQMPKTRDAYISSAREGGAGIMESFNELFKVILSTMAAASKVWARAKLTKNELKKCLESAGYASEYYAALEESKQGSLFVFALKMAITACGKKGYDPTIFQRWMDTRAAKVFKPGDDADEEDLDLDSLTDSLLTDEATDEAKTEPEVAADPASTDTTKLDTTASKG